MAAKNPGDLYKATCKVYAKDISISLHGSAVLFSHADGTKHKERSQKDTPISFLKRAEPLSSASGLLNNDARDSSEHHLQSKQQ